MYKKAYLTADDDLLTAPYFLSAVPSCRVTIPRGRKATGQLGKDKDSSTHSLHAASCPHTTWKGQGQLKATVCTVMSAHTLDRTRTAQTHSLLASSYSLERTRTVQPAVRMLPAVRTYLGKDKDSSTHNLHTAVYTQIGKDKDSSNQESARC